VLNRELDIEKNKEVIRDNLSSSASFGTPEKARTASSDSDENNTNQNMRRAVQEEPEEVTFECINCSG